MYTNYLRVMCYVKKESFAGGRQQAKKHLKNSKWTLIYYDRMSSLHIAHIFAVQLTSRLRIRFLRCS